MQYHPESTRVLVVTALEAFLKTYDQERLSSQEVADDLTVLIAQAIHQTYMADEDFNAVLEEVEEAIDDGLLPQLLDRVRPDCEQDFMAGTICTLVVGHDGDHAPICRECGVNWVNDRHATDCTHLTPDDEDDLGIDIKI